MTEDSQNLNRTYRDPRGVHVNVIRWEADKQRVVFMIPGYEHECFAPLEQFQKKYTRVL